MVTTTALSKLDLVKERPNFFKARTTPEAVELSEANYIAIDGEGEPGGPEFQSDVGALYAVAYTIKVREKSEGRDFKVPTFEASWTTDADGHELPRDQWRWQLSMMLPDYVDAQIVAEAKDDVTRRRSGLHVAGIRFERLSQGLCVQVLHVGPYATEDESTDKMLDYMRANRLQTYGPHHEVYLSDPNRCKPESIKTILRQRVIRCAD